MCQCVFIIACGVIFEKNIKSIKCENKTIQRASEEQTSHSLKHDKRHNYNNMHRFLQFTTVVLTDLYRSATFNLQFSEEEELGRLETRSGGFLFGIKTC